MSRFLRRIKSCATRGRAAFVGCAVVVAALAPRVAAQGCAMCYQSAAAGNDHSRVALQHGILILLIPSAGLFVGIFGLIYSRRNASLPRGQTNAEGRAGDALAGAARRSSR